MLTHWFPAARLDPERVGWYETCAHVGDDVVRRYWSGQQWGLHSASVLHPAVNYWRGLAQPPNGGGTPPHQSQGETPMAQPSVTRESAPVVDDMPRASNSTRSAKSFFGQPCQCGGNPRCFRCGGWGYLDVIGAGRASAGPTGSLMARRGNRSIRLRRKARKSSKRPTQPQVPCPHCSAQVRTSRLERHLARVHGVNKRSDPTVRKHTKAKQGGIRKTGS